MTERSSKAGTRRNDPPTAKAVSGVCPRRSGAPSSFPASSRPRHRRPGVVLLALSLLFALLIPAAALPAFAAADVPAVPGGVSLCSVTDTARLSGDLSRAGNPDSSGEGLSDSLLLTTALELIRWQRERLGVSGDGPLLCDPFLSLAGTPTGDWFPLAAARMGIKEDWQDYLAVIRSVVEERYRSDGALSRDRATECHRISLAILATGGDPARAGTASDGSVIDLIADGTYDSGRGVTAPAGRQGISGWIWGLIAWDSLDYPIPEDPLLSRETFLTEILRRQLPDGGFCFGGDRSDPDMTAMALTALAPYYNEETVYTFTREADGLTVNTSVRETVDRALALLCALQEETGEFSSWGTCNVESTCQVTIALCSLGIDPMTDTRFIKNGHTLPEVIFRYRTADGGFAHIRHAETGEPGAADTTASSQVMCALAALLRLSSGQRRLYDFRAEPGETMMARISALKEEIAALLPSDSASGEDVSATHLTALLRTYASLPLSERSYVTNYRVLSDAARAEGIDPAAVIAGVTVIPDPDAGAPPRTRMTFTEEDYARVMALPDRPGVAYRTTVIRLLGKLNGADNPYRGTVCRERLTAALREIEAVRAEIAALGEDIRSVCSGRTLHLGDRKTVEALIERYHALPPEDRSLVENGEELLRAQTVLRTRQRSLLVGTLLCAVALLPAGYLLRRLCRHLRKRSEPPFPESGEADTDPDTDTSYRPHH